MGLLDYFKQRKSSNSAAIAKERLQILVAHDRRGDDGPSYLPQLRQDLLRVIRKYVAVDNDAVSFNVESDGRREILELNIVLPD